MVVKWFAMSFSIFGGEVRDGIRIQIRPFIFSYFICIIKLLLSIGYILDIFQVFQFLEDLSESLSDLAMEELNVLKDLKVGLTPSDHFIPCCPITIAILSLGTR